ncbi:hypothetical protein Gekk315_00090 [Aeromonas phage Gekk3-15]
MKSAIAFGILSCIAINASAKDDLPFATTTIYSNTAGASDRATTITESVRANERVCMVLYREGFKFAAISASNKFPASVMVHGIQSAGGELRMDIGYGGAIPLEFSVNEGFFVNVHKMDNKDATALVEHAGKSIVQFSDPSGDTDDQFISAIIDSGTSKVFNECVERLK